MSLLLDPSFLRGFAILNTMVLAVGAGAATGMFIFAIPIIKDSNGSSATMVRQFHQLITRGAKYMQGGSRILAVSLVVLISLLYRHPDPEIARRWKYFAAALFIAVQVTWYEIVFIFPTNDRLVEMEGELKRAEDLTVDREARTEIIRLLEKWRRWHIGRIIIPLAAATISFYGL